LQNLAKEFLTRVSSLKKGKKKLEGKGSMFKNVATKVKFESVELKLG